MNKPTTQTVQRLLALALLATCAGCGAQMRSAGYTSQADKVWYQWWHGGSHNTIVVCDVAPNGAESNCKESEI